MTVPITESQDDFTGASISGNILTLTRRGGTSPVAINIPVRSDTEINNLADARIRLAANRATTTQYGVVEKATQAELTAGTADKFPDAAAVLTALNAKQDTLPVGTSGQLVAYGAGGALEAQDPPARQVDILFGESLPSASLGSDGDYYIYSSSSTFLMYRKVSGGVACHSGLRQ